MKHLHRNIIRSEKVTLSMNSIDIKLRKAWASLREKQRNIK